VRAIVSDTLHKDGDLKHYSAINNDGKTPNVIAQMPLLSRRGNVKSFRKKYGLKNRNERHKTDSSTGMNACSKGHTG
jgi:hypothetical protein